MGPGYFVQAGRGQLKLFQRSRPLEDVLKDERTSPRVRKLLERVGEIKAFGETQGLKPTPNYVDYVQWDSAALSWIVSASKALRFEPRTWSFPVVGSFTYVGWFDREDARDYAKRVENDGEPGEWDVDVRPTRAYSTLGWFKDPIISTMLEEGPSAMGELANVIIHESVHATLYINGQSYLNESMANFVAEQLTPVYLEGVFGRESTELKSYLEGERSGRERQKQMHAAYIKLQEIFASSATDEVKRAKKDEIYADLRSKLGSNRPLNNATLIQFRTYGVGREDFQKLFERVGRDWGRFWRVMNGLKDYKWPAPHMEDFGPVLAGLKE